MKNILRFLLLLTLCVGAHAQVAPDYIRHPSSMPCLFVGMPGSTSSTQASCGSNAAADGTTKGIATFTASDFDSSSGLISLDYTNGQAADASHKGFLTSTDWSTFNGKQAAGNYITALTGDVTASGPGSAAATIANSAVTTVKINNNAVTLTKLATQADQTALVNISGGAAAPTASTFDAANIQRTYYAASTSGTTTYTATLTPVPTAYVTGAQYVFTVTSTNTGAVTMNFNSLGAKNVLLNGVALAPGQLLTSLTYQAIYDGTQFQLTGSGSLPDLTLLPSSYQIDYDDFTIGSGVLSITAGGVSIGTFSTVTTAGASSAISRAGSTGDGMVGVLLLTHGTSVGGWALVQAGGDLNHAYDGPPWAVGGGQIEATFWFATDANLSNSTDNYGINVGLSDGSLNQPVPVGGSSILINANNAAANPHVNISVRVSGVNQTQIYSSTTLAASTKYVGKLVLNSARTRVDLYLRTYGGVFPSSPDASYTGTLPPSSLPLTPQMFIYKNAGTLSRQFFADRWQVVTRLAR